jgi:hypothetical protein
MFINRYYNTVYRKRSTTMSRLVSRAENWSKVYEAFSGVNFAAFDYNTVKQSLLENIKLTFPEAFNDFIESSELIAIIESFSYVCELLAYRFDLDASENFLSTAQRKDSILRLAKLVSYSADRQIPARGLVKITSVSTTENLVDASGNNLANRIIRWNDVTNQLWKDQFILVMDRVLEQTFGSVQPTDRFQIENVLFELHTLNINPLPNGVVGYNTKLNNQSIPMELVPIEYNSTDGIIERRPYNNANFTLVYGRDGLGDTSDTTGFFCYTKQGTLQRFRQTFDGVSPNQIFEIPLNDANQTDVWVNNVNPTTGVTLDTPPAIQNRRVVELGRTGEWVEVDISHAQNIIFNTNPRRNKYEVETTNNNRARVIFGDGEFADIPNGSFDFWARSSLDQNIVISQSSIVNQQASFTYVDAFDRNQTFTFTFPLTSSLQNNSSSETLEHIRATAPSVYYSQDRMVNGQDYNSFMLQDSSILKLQTLNRTFIGDSKYISWHDPSTTYENVKIFGNDGALYFQEKIEGNLTPVVSNFNDLITAYIEPLLSSTDVFIYVSSYGVPPSNFRRSFNSTEKARIVVGLTPPPSPTSFGMYYNVVSNEWYVVITSDDPSTTLAPYGWPSNFINQPLITVVQYYAESRYTINRRAKRIVFQSPTTTFWNTNNASSVVDYNTLNSDYDELVVLQANTNYNRASVLSSDWIFNILGTEVIDSGVEVGLTDNTRISIIPKDYNGDNIPDYLDINEWIYHRGLADIIKPKITVDLTGVPAPFPATGIEITLPISYVIGQYDVSVQNLGNVSAVLGVDWFEDTTSPTGVSNIIRLVNSNLANSLVNVSVNDFVYFYRAAINDDWTIIPTTPNVLNQYVSELITYTGLWKREIGRSSLNFAWFHHSPRYHLIDPASSNINDTLVIQKGYFLALKRWLEDSLISQPALPTPLDLRLAYNYLIDNKMISDTVVLRAGKIKLLFGRRAILPLQANFKIVRSSDNTMTDNQIKNIVVATVRNFFDPTLWEFGETFYFTELAAAVHKALPIEISTFVIVPVYENNNFGELFQVQAAEDEIFYPDITENDINLVSDINASTIRLSQQTTCPVTHPNIFTQSTYEYAYEFAPNVPTSSWTIVHELGFYPVVRVYDVSNNEIQPSSVIHLNVQETIIMFKSPTVGRARLV